MMDPEHETQQHTLGGDGDVIPEQAALIGSAAARKTFGGLGQSISRHNMQPK
jgi:hypothetical protein